MNERSKGSILAAAVLALTFSAASQVARAQAGATTPAAAPAPKTAEQVYKNIQTFKGMPADEIIPAMQFISNSLGVDCEHCHVEHAFDKDDKKPKETARKMIQMQMAINKDNFHSRTEVTCNSCHNGAGEPTAIPVIADSDMKSPGGPAPGAPGTMHRPGEGPGANVPNGPPANEVIEKYVQALGGADALQKISSRVEKGTLSGFGPNKVPVEIYAKAPNMRLSVMHTPRGDSSTAYDGHAAWMVMSGQPPREISGGELAAAKLDADFYFPTHVKQDFQQLRPWHPEKVGDQEAYVILGITPGQPPAKLYFDEHSGLLIRMLTYAETPLGRNPTETDYADYRDADGVKIPYHWTIARPRGRFTIEVDQVQQNVPIDDAKFAKPPAPPEGQKPGPGQ